VPSNVHTGTRLEDQQGLSEIVNAANDELRALMASTPRLQLRLTATDSDSVLESVIPHFVQEGGPTLPSLRHGTGLERVSPSPVSFEEFILLPAARRFHDFLRNDNTAGVFIFIQGGVQKGTVCLGEHPCAGVAVR
jgi:hypothetical protein